MSRLIQQVCNLCTDMKSYTLKYAYRNKAKSYNKSSINDKQTAKDPHDIKLGEQDHPDVYTRVEFMDKHTHIYANLDAQKSQVSNISLCQGIAQQKWGLLNQACVFNQPCLLELRTCPTSSHSHTETHSNTAASPVTQPSCDKQMEPQSKQ